MQAIERVGVLALVLLVVIVGAVVMWDDGAEEPGAKPKSTPAKATQAVQAPARTESRPPQELARAPERGPSRLEQGAASAATQGSAPSTRSAPGGGDVGLSLPTAGAQQLPPPPKPRTEDRPEPARPAPPAAASAPEKEAATPPAEARRETAAARTQPADGARTHVVKEGETLSDVSAQHFGTVKRWKEIADLNAVDPNRLKVGAVLRLPAGAGAAAAAPATASAKDGAAAGRYRVAEGDSLWLVAERVLGDGERWKEIAAANPGIDANRLVVGAWLALPSGAAVPAKTAEPARRPSAPTVAQATPRPSKKGVVR